MEKKKKKKGNLLFVCLMVWGRGGNKIRLWRSDEYSRLWGERNAKKNQQKKQNTSKKWLFLCHGTGNWKRERDRGREREIEWVSERERVNERERERRRRWNKVINGKKETK